MLNMNSNGIDQTQFDLKLEQAEFYAKQGLSDEADAVYQDLLDILKKLPETKSTQLQIKQLESIRNGIGASISLKASDKEAGSPVESKPDEELYAESTAFVDLGFYDKAIVNNKILIERNFKIYESISTFVSCSKTIEQEMEAVKYLDSIVKSSSSDTEKKDVAYYFLSFLYEKIGNFGRSISSLQNIKATDNFTDYSNRVKFLGSKIKGKTRFDYLLSEQIIIQKDLKQAIELSKKTQKSVEYILINKFSVAIDQLGKSLGMFYGYPFVDISQEGLKTGLFGKLKHKYLKNNHWAPLEISGKKQTVDVVVANLDMQCTEDIKKIYVGYKTFLHIGIQEHIDEYINKQYDNETPIDNTPAEEGKGEDVSGFMDGIEEDELEDIVIEKEDKAQDDEEEAAPDSKVILFANKMIVDARRRRASDIHIEPSTHSLSTDIRFRVDGLCQPYRKIPNSFSRQVISRIKIMADMDIAERRKPMDGKILFKSKQTGKVELRVATLPTSGGKEDVVLRLLQSGKPAGLAELGVLEYNIEPFLKIIHKPYGLVLVVGPTGSGKTTTLHSALSIINTPEKKIWTAEDPVEIDQKGIRQSEVHRKIGLDFATLLRAFLRADPDVIMVGEMRDVETTKIGIEASLTGHLVFSTLHTNNAPETITRLIEIGIDRTNFADSLLGILAQRLGRRLCNECKKEAPATKEEIDSLIKEFGSDNMGMLNKIDKDNLKLYHPVGCANCANTGYRGRIGFHELLINNDTIKALIKKEAAVERIRAAAVANNMYTLKQDGIIKVLEGITDMTEVRRNCI
ncbi:MAG: type II/IV secretion system protein [Nitrospinae bacterium]|nr:type II/IV secretion system protein [Nitrospinota bacterium]